MFSLCSKLLILLVLGVVFASADERVRNPSKRKGAGPLFQIVRNDKWGFMDRTGRVVIAPAFAEERDFFHGLAAVKSPEGKWGFIDESGTLAIAARFDEVQDFTDDLAPVRIGRKSGYIDKSGKMVIEPRYQSAGEFHEGLARIHLWNKLVCTVGTFTSDDAPLYAFHLLEDDKTDGPGCFAQGGKFGYIDKTGKEVIAPQFFLVLDFSEGLAAVRVEQTSESKYGYIDRTGHMVIEPRFDQAEPFSEGLAAVHVNNEWGFIDKAGMLKIPYKYRFAGTFSEGLARVAMPGNDVRMGFINHSGKVVIPARFTRVYDFSEGLAGACASSCFYINRSGARVLKDYSPWWPFVDGLAVVSGQDSQVYINNKGRVIAPYDSDK